MSRTQESGAYLGGIGAMLGMTHGCPACGQVHEGRSFGLKHRAPRECPLVVVGNFPIVSLPPPPAPETSVRPSNGRRTSQFGIPSDADLLLVDALAPVQVARTRETERTRGIGVPWLPPPDLGELF